MKVATPNGVKKARVEHQQGNAMTNPTTKRESASDSVRLPATLLELARDAGELEHRSIPNQLEYWARIGRTVAESPSVRGDTIRALIKSGRTFDELNEAQKIVIVTDADTYFETLDGDLELARDLLAEGRPLARGVNGRVEFVTRGSTQSKRLVQTGAAIVKRAAASALAATGRDRNEKSTKKRAAAQAARPPATRPSAKRR